MFQIQSENVFVYFTSQILSLIIFCQEISIWRTRILVDRYLWEYVNQMEFENNFTFVSAIVPYFVTVILTYHGVTEDAISSVGTEEVQDVAGMEEAGSGVDLDLSILVIFLSSNQFLPLFEVL